MRLRILLLLSKIISLDNKLDENFSLVGRWMNNANLIAFRFDNDKKIRFDLSLVGIIGNIKSGKMCAGCLRKCQMIELSTRNTT
jgi:hypothetical protein